MDTYSQIPVGEVEEVEVRVSGQTQHLPQVFNEYFDNQSGLRFYDISNEIERTYRFEGGETVTIEAPCAINVSENGGHRLYDTHGNFHYIPAGWIHLTWRTEDKVLVF